MEVLYYLFIILYTLGIGLIGVGIGTIIEKRKHSKI